MRLFLRQLKQALCDIKMTKRIWIDTRDKPGLLNAMMKISENKGSRK